MKSKPVSYWLALALLLGVSLPVRAETGPKDIVLALDNSGSMKDNDPEFLTGAAVRKFLQRLGGDTRIAIVVFDEKVRLSMPLTPLDDSSRANMLRSLEQVDRSGQRTDIPGAIERAIYELRAHGRPAADRSIVFLTDGIVDTGNAAMDAEKSAWLRTDLADHAADEGIRIFGIAFTEGADFLLIQSLSRRTSGEYFRVFSPEDTDAALERVLAALAKPLTARGPEQPAATAEAAAASGDAPAEPPSPAPPVEASSPAGAPGDPSPVAAGDAAGDIALPAETEAPEPALPSPPVAATTPSPAPARDPGPTLAPPLLVAAGAGGIGLLLLGMFLKRRRSHETQTFPPTLPKALLNDLGGVTAKPSYEIGDNLTVIGRLRGSDEEDTDYVIISEPTIGRRHAMIRYRDHAFWIIDQSSLNGTFVNDKRIEGETRLRHGDRLRFYRYEFEFQQLDMLESEGTMLSETMQSQVPDDHERRPLTGTEKTTANPGLH